MLGRLGTNDLTGASGLIGRQAEFSNSVSALSGSAPAQWRWSLPSNASTITAEIRDSSGKLVATPAVTPGETSGTLSWDGLLADGSKASGGAYALKLIAKDDAGAAISPAIHSIGRVQDVTQRNNELWLGLGGQVSLPISDLLGVASIG